MTPEELHVIPSPAATPMIALNFTGQTIYAVSASGLTVLTLPEPVDQIPSAQWPFRRPKSSRSARPALHGSLASRAAMQANR
jgi:hypothetical protein